MTGDEEGAAPELRPRREIRCRGAIHLHAERDRPRVIVSAPDLPHDEASARLAKLARAHRLAAGTYVPAVAEVDLACARPWVALASDAVADLETVTDGARRGSAKPTLAQATSLERMVMTELARVHAIRDPDTGAGLCLGSLSPANLLFSASGELAIVGFGLPPFANACLAPEIAAGEPPTPGADVFATLLFVRAQIAITEIPAEMLRVFAGRAQDGDGELVRLLQWSNARILAAAPPDRASMAESLEVVRHMWSLFGVTPDPEGFAAYVASSVGPAGPSLVVSGDGEWLELDGQRVALETRRPLTRMVLALARARIAEPGVALSLQTLVEIAWPGEDLVPDVGSNRVYVAVSTIRKLGLGALLQRRDGGYRLDPGAACRIVDAR